MVPNNYVFRKYTGGWGAIFKITGKDKLPYVYG